MDETYEKILSTRQVNISNSNSLHCVHHTCFLYRNMIWDGMPMGRARSLHCHMQCLFQCYYTCINTLSKFIIFLVYYGSLILILHIVNIHLCSAWEPHILSQQVQSLVPSHVPLVRKLYDLSLQLFRNHQLITPHDYSIHHS